MHLSIYPSFTSLALLMVCLTACNESDGIVQSSDSSASGQTDSSASGQTDSSTVVEGDAGAPASGDSAVEAGEPTCIEEGCPAAENGTNVCMGSACVLTCVAGFTERGGACINIDECVGVDCQNGASCVDGVAAYTCDCAAGFAGDHCEQEVCGDGVGTLSEECDDRNRISGDGCSALCQLEWGFFCDVDMGLSVCASQCGDGIRASDEGCDDGNGVDEDGCSAQCEVEEPVTFACAIANHQAQVAAAPDYWYAEENGGLAPTADRQPWRRTWEPLLEAVPGCNGLPWDSDAIDRPRKEFSFVVVLDAGWVSYYADNADHFARQGYPTLESSPGLLLDRVSYLFEAQFAVRISAQRVIPLPGLLEKCAANNLNVENDVPDETNTWAALAAAGVELTGNEAGVMRIGVGAADGVTYCHSSAPIDGVCDRELFVNQRAPFQGNTGRLNHEAARTLAHELGHFFGVCSDDDHPHCLNGHLANQIPDLMVWDGRPAVNVRDFGMFYKFMPSCSPVYDTLLCGKVKSVSAECGVPLTCENGGLDCTPSYWSARGSRSPEGVNPTPSELRPRGHRLAVRCCSNTEPVTCRSSDLGGLVSMGDSRECSGQLTWPEAELFCRQAGLRLCSLDEITQDDLCRDSGCEYDQERVWTGTPADLVEQ